MLEEIRRSLERVEGREMKKTESRINLTQSLKYANPAQSRWLKHFFFFSCCTTLGLLVVLLLILFGFGESIAHFETPREIDENREFQGLLDRLRELNISDEDFDLVVLFSGRDEIRGIEGFSTFIEEDNDWTGATPETFFGAASYTFDLASTIGYGSFTAKTDAGRALSIACIIVVFPVAVLAYTRFVDLIYNSAANLLMRSDSKYKAVIAQYDAEKSGSLNVKELYLIFQDLELQVTNEQTEMILRQYDFNHDEHLNESEFRQLCIDLNIKVGLLGRQYFQFEFALIGFIVYSAIFTTVSVFALELSVFESFYFVIVTVSTVGLGDVVPPQRLRAPFSLLAFIGVGFTALLFRAIIDKMYEKTDLRKRYFRRALEPVFDARKQRIKSVRVAHENIPGQEEKGDIGVTKVQPQGENEPRF